MTQDLVYRSTRNDEAPRRARGLVGVMLAGFHERDVEDTALMVSELMTNAVSHGAGDATLTLHLDEGRLNVAVSDKGTSRPEQRAAAASGGWGLNIIDSRADRWGVEDGSTHVWFEIRLR